MGKFKGKNIFKIHQWAGLMAGVFIFLMGITGSVLVFHHDLDAIEHRTVWTVSNSAPVSIDRAYAAVIGEYQNWDIRLQRFSANPNEILVFQLRRPDRRLTVFTHPSTGEILKEVDTEDTLVNWILKLHYALHAGLVGEIIILLVGIAYLISLITGVIVYRKSILKTLTFSTRVNRRSKRTLASTLHRYVGVWALLLNLLVVLTGAVISYEIVANALKKPAGPAPLAENLPIKTSIDQALKTIASQNIHFKPSYIRFPQQLGAPVLINGRADNQSLFYSQYYNSITLNPESGELSGPELANTKSTAIQVSSLVRGIHFVEFGNWAVKILFMLIGLSAPLLSITGFLLWKWKHKRK
ncbi:MAG TPA: PepSY-associated TM helix domain-containing protein [Sphingobacteriaceae bacterium]